MHRVAVVADHQSSQAPRSSTSHPPIGSYPRVPVQVHQADPYAPEAARRLIALIATRYPSAPAEHVGSSAVPRLAGKNIIDLLMAATPADVAAITAALLAGPCLFHCDDRVWWLWPGFDPLFHWPGAFAVSCRPGLRSSSRPAPAERT